MPVVLRPLLFRWHWWLAAATAALALHAGAAAAPLSPCLLYTSDAADE